MTKKSQGRLMRDAMKKEGAEELNNNDNWTGLLVRYNECRELMLMHLGVGEILANPDIAAEIKEHEGKILASNIQLLTKDLEERAQELAMIYNTHKDKSGSATVDDIMLSFEIMEKYTAWLSLVEANVQPTMAHILEITSEVEKRVIAKQAALDPNVVTDVEAKTPSAEQSQSISAGIAAADHHSNPKAE